MIRVYEMREFDRTKTLKERGISGHSRKVGILTWCERYKADIERVPRSRQIIDQVVPFIDIRRKVLQSLVKQVRQLKIVATFRGSRRFSGGQAANDIGLLQS